MDLDGQWWEHSTYGDVELYSAWISFAFGSRNTAVGNGEHASTFNMPELWDRLQGADCNDKETSGLANLCNEVGKDWNATDLLSHCAFTFKLGN